MGLRYGIGSYTRGSKVTLIPFHTQNLIPFHTCVHRYSTVEYQSSTRTPSPPVSSPISKSSKSSPRSPQSPMATAGEGGKRPNGLTRLEPKGKHLPVSHSNHGQYQNEEAGSLSVDKPLKVRPREDMNSSNQSDRRISSPKVVHVNGISSKMTRSQPSQHEGGPPSRYPDPRLEGGPTQLHHQHNVQSRFRNTYSQHLPSALKKPHANQGPPPGDVTTPPTQGARMSRGTRTSHIPNSSSNHTSSSNHVSDSKHTSNSRNPKVQFQYEDQHIERPRLQKSGIPMRATKSAQIPHDAPLTGYPRSHMEAVQRRTASNGRVQHPNQYVTSPRSGHAHQGVHSGGFHAGGHAHFHRVSNRNDTDMMVGSLV